MPSRAPLLAPLAAVMLAACAAPPASHQNIVATHDPATGRLQEIALDRDSDGRFDSWTTMDGARVVRIDLDENGDGVLDRWEYYAPGGALERVGTSRAGGGAPDTWSWPAADGSIARVDVAGRPNGPITRTEYFVEGTLDRAVEDGDGDGHPEKWETYVHGRLASVEFDTTGRGRRDRRLVYEPDGSAQPQRLDPDGGGRFEPAP